MSRAIERGKAFYLEMIDGLKQEIEEAGLTEAFKEYLVEQNFVSEDERALFPNSVKQMCDGLALRFRWSMFDTADTLFDVGERSGMLPNNNDVDDNEASSTMYDWRQSGF